jgi:hypothetical protein
MASIIVGWSAVGPVTDRSPTANGATITRSLGFKCGATNEVGPGRHALAAIHQQGKGRRHQLGGHEIELLDLAVLTQREIARVQAADEPAFLVLNGDLEQHAAH